MSSIITRPHSIGPHELAVTAPGNIEMDGAMRTMDRAQDVVTAYVGARRKGYQIGCTVWRKSIELTGFGKVWRDERGHRVFKRVHVTYGDWARLDTLIAEAIEHYSTSKVKL